MLSCWYPSRYPSRRKFFATVSSPLAPCHEVLFSLGSDSGTRVFWIPNDKIYHRFYIAKWYVTSRLVTYFVILQPITHQLMAAMACLGFILSLLPLPHAQVSTVKALRSLERRPLYARLAEPRFASWLVSRGSTRLRSGLRRIEGHVRYRRKVEGRSENNG
eukprot:1318224-Amorphochlora_amoeboformis.AAC.3